MRITCPECGFARTVPDDKIPATSTKATCPKCKVKFTFRDFDEHPSFALETETRGTETPEQAPPSPESVAPEPALEESATRESAVREPATREPAVREPAAPPSRHIQVPPEPSAFWAPEESEPRSDSPPGSDVEAQPEQQDAFPEQDGDAYDPSSADAETRCGAEQAPDVAPQETEAPEPSQELQPAAEESPLPEGAREPAAPDKAPIDQASDKDGVRDIWARLQAMDGGRGNADQNEAAPAPPVESGEAPWERTDAYGLFAGFFLTLKRILFQPVDFFEAMPKGRSATRALLFYLILAECIQLASFLWITFEIQNADSDPAWRPWLSVLHVSNAAWFARLLLLPVVYAVLLSLFAAILHVLLVLFQGASRPLKDTARVTFYAAAPVIFYAVPVTRMIMLPVIFPWVLALQAIGLKKTHQGPYANTLAAVFVVWSIYLFAFMALVRFQSGLM